MSNAFDFTNPRMFGNDSFFKPPTLYSILDSYLNFENPNPVKISNLAKDGRCIIFDFDYDLTDKISKEDFEKMILNKFLMRRIGFETLTAFKVQLYVKLNEILPVYNKLFEALDGWELFINGETITHTLNDNGSTSNTINNSSTGTNTSSSNTSGNNTSDRRFSELPQNEIHEVSDGNYMTQYNKDTNNDSSTASSSSSNTTTNNTTNNETTGRILTETTERTQNDLISIYNKFIENRNNIYTLIFKDLDCLFYQLV